MARPQFFGDDRAEARELDRLEGHVAGEQVVDRPLVVGFTRGDGTDDGILVRLSGGVRQVLANLNAGHVGGDGLERPSNLRRGIGLEVKRVKVRGPSTLPDENAGDLGLTLFRRLGRSELEVIPQAEAEETKGARLNEISSPEEGKRSASLMPFTHLTLRRPGTEGQAALFSD